jgi:hypothetical protein
LQDLSTVYLPDLVLSHSCNRSVGYCFLFYFWQSAILNRTSLHLQQRKVESFSGNLQATPFSGFCALLRGQGQGSPPWF